MYFSLCALTNRGLGLGSMISFASFEVLYFVHVHLCIFNALSLVSDTRRMDHKSLKPGCEDEEVLDRHRDWIARTNAPTFSPIRKGPPWYFCDLTATPPHVQIVSQNIGTSCIMVHDVHASVASTRLCHQAETGYALLFGFRDRMSSRPCIVVMRLKQIALRL